MQLKDLMLTDAERQALEHCKDIGGYHGKCDERTTICRECLGRERAAIIKAVKVLELRGHFYHPLYHEGCAICALLKEVSNGH